MGAWAQFVWQILQPQFGFLKAEQIDTSLLPSDLPPLSLNLAVINEVSIDEQLEHKIRLALPLDADIGPYLDQLKNPDLPRDEATQQYLQPFLFHAPSQLVLRNGLVYIPQSDGIKLTLLHLHHDAKTAGHCHR